jgi:ribonuclease-3
MTTDMIILTSSPPSSDGGERELSPKKDISDLCLKRGVNRQSVEACLNTFTPPDSEQIRIRSMDLHIAALSHKSVAKEYQSRHGNNERLEFLGDSVINLVVTKYLYDRYPEKAEGFLTRIRTKLVRSSCLAFWARDIGLHELIMMSSKALVEGWNTNTKKLEDVFEAIVGSLFLDVGIAACKRLLYPMLDRVDYLDVEEDTNWKDLLLRKMQAVHSYMVTNQLNMSQYGTETLPAYVLIGTRGSEHSKMFAITVTVAGAPVGQGEHTRKKEAEQLAAKMALDTIAAYGLPNIPSRLGYSVTVPTGIVQAT